MKTKVLRASAPGQHNQLTELLLRSALHEALVTVVGRHFYFAYAQTNFHCADARRFRRMNLAVASCGHAP